MKVTLREDREFLYTLDSDSQVFLCPCSNVGLSYMMAMNVGIPKSFIKDNKELYDNFDQICDNNTSFDSNSKLDKTLLSKPNFDKKVLRVWGVASKAARNTWYKMNVGDIVVFNRGSEEFGKEYYAFGRVSAKIESSDISYYLSKKQIWEKNADGYKYVFFIEDYNIISLSKKEFGKKFGITSTYPSIPFKLFPGKNHKEFGNVQERISTYFKEIIGEKTQTKKGWDRVRPDMSLDEKPVEKIAKKDIVEKSPKKLKPKKISIKDIELIELKRQAIESVGRSSQTVSAGDVTRLVDKIDNKKHLKHLIKVPDQRNLKSYYKLAIGEKIDIAPKKTSVKQDKKSKKTLSETDILISDFMNRIGSNTKKTNKKRTKQSVTVIGKTDAEHKLDEMSKNIQKKAKINKQDAKIDKKLKNIRKKVLKKIATKFYMGKTYSRSDINNKIDEPTFKYNHEGLYYCKNTKTTILFVTLDKDSYSDAYNDYFDKTGKTLRFHWDSQNKQHIDTPRIKEIREKEVEILLFCRKEKTDKNNRTALYVYCGRLEYDYHDEETSNPVHIIFRSIDYNPVGGIDKKYPRNKFSLLREIWEWGPNVEKDIESLLNPVEADLEKESSDFDKNGGCVLLLFIISIAGAIYGLYDWFWLVIIIFWVIPLIASIFGFDY